MICHLNDPYVLNGSDVNGTQSGILIGVQYLATNLHDSVIFVKKGFINIEN